VWIWLLVLLILATGCQQTCEERCEATQARCFAGQQASLCDAQCDIPACADCFRCLDDEEACGSDAVCQDRCLGCSRVPPP
jgi:hypothetical protein